MNSVQSNAFVPLFRAFCYHNKINVQLCGIDTLIIWEIEFVISLFAYEKHNK